MLIIVIASLKTNETIDQPTINNSSQTNRLQTCAILYKAQVTCTCTKIDSLYCVSCLEIKGLGWLTMKKTIYFFIQKFQR
jgi:hypothetical protein